MRQALLIAAKDLRQRIRDRSALLVAVVAPLGLALIFSQLLGSATDFSTKWIVADLDGGALARVLREDVIGSMEDAGVAEITDVATEDEARAPVESGDVNVAFIIPNGFTKAIEAGQPVALEVVGAQDSTLGTEIARSLAQRFGDGVVGVQLSVATVAGLSGSALAPEEQQRIAAVAAVRPRQPVALVDEEAALRQLGLPTYFSASMAILFLFFSAQMGVVSLFEERRQGTLARMLAGPIRPQTILFGKRFGSFVQGMTAMTLLVVATTLLIGADWGPPIGVAAVVVAGVLAAIGIATLVTSFARTADAATAANSAVAITLGIFGGTFSPTSQAPEIMATVALLTPHGWFMRGLGDMQGAGASLVDCLPSVGVLLAIALVTGGDRDGARPATGGPPMIQPGKVLDIARVNLVRQFRDRGDLFFVFVMPTMIIFALGLQFGGVSTARLGVVAPTGDEAAAALVDLLAADGARFEIRSIADEATLREQVERGMLEAGVVIPDGFAGALEGTGTANVRYLGTTDSLTLGLRAPVEAAIARVAAATTAARVVVAEGIADWDTASDGGEVRLRGRARRRGRRLGRGRSRDVRRLLAVHVRRVHAARHVHVPDLHGDGRAARLHEAAGHLATDGVDPDVHRDDRGGRGVRTAWHRAHAGGVHRRPDGGRVQRVVGRPAGHGRDHRRVRRGRRGRGHAGRRAVGQPGPGIVPRRVPRACARGARRLHDPHPDDARGHAAGLPLHPPLLGAAGPPVAHPGWRRDRLGRNEPRGARRVRCRADDARGLALPQGDRRVGLRQLAHDNPANIEEWVRVIAHTS